MFSRSCFLIILLSCCKWINGQTVATPGNSLKELTDRAYQYYTSSPDSGIIVARKAVTLAKQLGDERGLASAYNVLGINYWAKGQDSLALLAFEETRNGHQRARNIRGEARVLNNLALIYYNQADYRKAIDYHEQAAKLFDQLNDEQGLANTFNNLGVVFLALDHYPKALHSFLDALRHAGQDEGIRANALCNLGLVYKNLEKFSKALTYYAQALKVFKKQDNKRAIANTMGNIGSVYDLMKKPDTALQCYQQALAMNKSLGNQKQVASDLSNMGITYKNMHQSAKARVFLQRAVKVYQEIDDKANLAITLNELAGLYREEGNRIDLDTAMSFQQKALQLAVEVESPETQSAAWLGLSMGYELQHKPSEALKAYKQYVLLRDSVYNAEKEKEILSKALQYDFDKKEEQMKAAQEKQKIIMVGLSGCILVLLLMGSIAYLLYKKKRDADERRKEADYRTLVAETEMKALRAQMNPHFIFNSLNAIGQYIASHNLEAADVYLSRFAGVMRMILEHSEHKEIPLADDLKALELYMQLEAMRLKHAFSYDISLDPAIDPENTLVPPMILQPFVENSIWHGLTPMEKPGRISIAISLNKNELCCAVTDDGVGIHSATKPPAVVQIARKSMGIRITESRIALANKTPDTRGGIKLQELAEGVRVEIKIPYILHF